MIIKLLYIKVYPGTGGFKFRTEFFFHFQPKKISKKRHETVKKIEKLQFGAEKNYFYSYLNKQMLIQFWPFA